MRCVAAGKPFPFIRWYKDGYMVKNLFCYKTFPCFEISFKVWFFSLYECLLCSLVWERRVEVLQSDVWWLWDVPVHRRKCLGHQIRQCRAASHRWALAEPKYPVKRSASAKPRPQSAPPACAPTFELNPVKKQLLGANDARVLIECKPRAAPRPRFTWTKGKELLFNSSRSDWFLWNNKRL